MAKKRINGQNHYFIRETVQCKEGVECHDLLELGMDPSEYIVYPGGKSFYIRLDVEDSLEAAGVATDQEELEEIFWPFLKPEIQRAQEPYRSRAKAMHREKFTPQKERSIREHVHIFDKRRLHFIRFGKSHSGSVAGIPTRMLKKIEGKSRDEIEQQFMAMEERFIKQHEKKIYIYIIFDLQRFFTSSLAKKAPEALSAEEMDRFFLKEICALNSSKRFWGNTIEHDSLDDYLVRYLIMYFDNDFATRNVLKDYIRDFINRHKGFGGYPAKISVSFREAGGILEVSENELKNISKSALTRLYRRLAHKHHPDRGGEQEKFVKLTDAYRSIMRKRGFGK